MKRAQGARITRTVDAERAAGTDKAPVTDPAGQGGVIKSGTLHSERDEPETVVPLKADEPDRFTEMTGKELKAEAQERDIDLTGLKTVGDLRALLRSLEK